MTENDANILLKEFGDCWMKANEDIVYLAVIKKGESFEIEMAVKTDDKIITKTVSYPEIDLVCKLDKKNSKKLNLSNSLINDINKTGCIQEKSVSSNSLSFHFQNRNNRLTINLLNRRIRPLCPGLNIGYKYGKSSGTIGAIVKFKNKKELFILTNSHVITGFTEINNRIITQPFEGNCTNGFEVKHVIAKGTKYRVFNETLDVAFAEILQNDLVIESKILEHNLPNGITVPTIGMEIKKIGATTGFTEGKIKSTNAYIRIDKNKLNTNFSILKNQLLLSNMSSDGDSGSIIVEKENGNAVGLLIGGDNKNYSIANNIDYIFGISSGKAKYLKNLKFEKFI